MDPGGHARRPWAWPHWCSHCYHGFEPGLGLPDKKRSVDRAGKLPSARRARCLGHPAWVGEGCALGAQKQGAATKGLTDGEATRSASPPHPRSRRPLRFTSQAGTAWSQRHHTPARHTDHTWFPGMAATQLASLALMVPLQGSSGSLEGRRSWIVQATLGDSYSPSLGEPAHW